MKKRRKKKGIKSRRPLFDTRGTMVAALAHEIKNPLNSIKGASQYIFNKYQEKKDIKEFMGLIIDEIDRLDRYLNEFLSFSRGTELRLKKSNILNYLTGVVMVSKHSFPCEIRIIPKKNNIPLVYIDHEQLMQVMLNLMSNAKDAIKDLKNPKTEIIVDYDSRYVYLTVKDNGAGISKANQKKVFMAFYSTKETGIGIGLTICKTIVKKHKGTIKVKSAPGKGAAFTVSISRKLAGAA